VKSARFSWGKILANTPSRYAFISLVSVILLLPPLVIARLSHEGIKEQLTQYSISRKQNTAKIAALIIKERLERTVDLANSLSTRVQFRKHVAAGAWQEAAKIIERIPFQYDYVERIFVTDPRGTIMLDEPPLGQTVGLNFAHRDWYVGVSSGWKPYVSNIYQRKAEPKYNVVAVATPIFDGEPTENVVGILVVQIRADTILRWMRQIEMEPGGSLFVIDKSGAVVSGMAGQAQAPMENLADFAPVQKALAGQSGTMTAAGPGGGQDYFSVFESIGNFGWCILSLFPADEAFVMRNLVLRVNRVIIVSFFIIQLLLIVLLMGGLNRLILLSISLQQARVELEKRVEERTQELQRSHDQLKETNRDLEQFAYVASHDLQEPLRSITSFVQLFAKKYGDNVDEEGRNYIRYIVNGSKRMEAQIRDLLAYSRTGADAIVKEPVDVNEALDQALANLAQLIQERKAVITRGKLPKVRFQKQMVSRVLENLISNAIKYCNDKAPQVHIDAAQDGDHWIISVKDNGIGIEEKYHGRIFELFERLHGDGEYSGTGMGLAIIRRIVERNGGKVTVASKPGEGSTFLVHIRKKG
jgi:signal transduction histidine kinase